MRTSVFSMTPRDASVFTPSGTRKQMFGSLVFQAVQSENHPVLSEGNPLPEHIRWSHPIRYPDPLIKPNDTIKLDLEENKVVEFIKSDVGKVVMVTGGRNRGRVGVIKNRTKPWVSLPKGKGINKLTIIEEARKRLSAQQAA
ncbi:hypothetical protein HID58_017402 [Brassica napus]|uniref:Small ribosomal subunit protein eS4 C-terminal domain-containing protein n=1 Tax=Brassica napus TaxID=3708 RepID=A0ABQ8D9T0_BRANA|nr:hypothetical protein HID58_017402 [Brassica napus]